MDLAGWHTRIGDELNIARAARDTPFSLIEHGLGEDDRAAIRGALRRAVAARPLTDEPWWRSRALPLLLVATEVGYSFGEHHAVYWANLELELDRSLTEQERTALAKRFRGAGLRRAPPPVPWAQHASRVAWPISQAVAPRWLHAPLLQLLGRCPVQIEASRAYLSWIYAELGARDRLRLLVHPTQEDLAHAVVEAVLSDGGAADDGLAPAFAARLRADVLSAPIARGLRHAARRRQLELRNAAPLQRAPPAPAAAPTPPRALLRVDLLIDLDAMSLRLGPLRHPALGQADAGLRAAPLDERRSAPLQALALGGAALTRPPSADVAPVFGEQWTAAIKGQAGVIARGLWVSGRRPLVFSGRGSVARQQLDRGFGEAGALLVLHPAPLADARGLSLLGRVAGEWLHHVDLAEHDAREALAELGLEPQAAPVVSIVGPPPWGQRGEETYGDADVVGLVVARGAVTLCGPAGEERSLQPGCYRLGTAELRVAARRECDPPERAVNLEVLRGATAAVGPAITPAGAGAPTRAALLGRRLGLVVRRPVGAVDLRLRLSLLAEGCPPRRAWTRALGQLPAAVAPDDPAWEWLARGVPAGDRLRLRAELPGLATVEWPLSDADEDVEAADQDVDIDADAAEVNEEGAGRADGLSLSDGALPAPTQRAWRLDRLDQALGCDLPGGSIALIGHHDGLFGPRARVEAPRAVGLAELRAPKAPTVARRGTAVVDALSHLWRWARAEAVGGVAHAARVAGARAWERALVEATCGPAWAEAEAELPIGAADGAAEETAVAERLLVLGVAWHIGDPPDHDRPRALRELARALQAERRCGEPPPRGDGVDRLLNDVSEWVQDALVHAGAQRGRLDPPVEEGPALEALAPLWRRPARRTIPSPLLPLILPESARASVERCLSDAPSLDAAAEAVAGVAGSVGWGVAWSAQELALLARLWLAERPPQWGAAERAAVAAAAERAAVDQRGARLSRLLALVAGGALGVGGSR